MDKALSTTGGVDAAVLEQVVINGDLEKLTPEMRVAYYRNVCESLGLNPFTKPFDYIKLNGKLTLYAKKDATDQLRTKHAVSVRIVSRERMDDLYVVTAEATDRNGRVDTEIGAVSIAGLKGESLANAMMKAVTKAKRRVTLSVVGLGWLDETEVDSIPSAQAAPQYTQEITRVQPAPETQGVVIHDTLPERAATIVDAATGEIVEAGSPGERAFPATDKQIKAIFGKGRAAGWTNDELRDLVVNLTGKTSTNDLTMAEASAIIEHIDAGSAPTDTEQPSLIEV